MVRFLPWARAIRAKESSLPRERAHGSRVRTRLGLAPVFPAGEARAGSGLSAMLPWKSSSEHGMNRGDNRRTISSHEGPAFDLNYTFSFP